MSAPDPEFVQLLTQLRTLDADPDAPAGAHHDLTEQLYTRYLDLARGGTTPGGLPYPDPADPVSEGADAIRALAEAVEARTPFAGTVSLPTSLNSSVTSAILTFPAGRFSTPPVVTATAATSAPNYRSVTIGTVTTTSVGIYYSNTSGTSIGVSAHVIAQRNDADPLTFSAAAAPTTVATCHTDGCSNAGVAIPIDVDWTDDDGIEHHVDLVVCGVCGRPITDVTPTEGGH